MSPNAPVVEDGLQARIRALRSKDQGLQTVGVVLRGNGVSHDLATRNPSRFSGVL
jgi:hypothetical protein